MTSFNRASLYKYFLTGSKPTQSQFANLIDSFVSLVDVTAQSIASDIIVSGSFEVVGQATIDNAIVISSAVGGNKGSGTINATGYYLNGTILTISSAGGSGTVSVGAVNQLAYYQAATNTVVGTSALPSGIIATTQPTNDSSSLISTTAFANPASSVNANGYVKLPSGVIIQWGANNISSGTANVAFPLLFPNAVYSLSTSINGQSGVGSVSLTTSNLILSGFSAYGGSSGNTFPFSWIAIGN